jgi:hypothetical protein
MKSMMLKRKIKKNLDDCHCYEYKFNKFSDFPKKLGVGTGLGSAKKLCRFSTLH